MVAFVKRMPAGVPGAITRPWETTAEPILVTGPAAAANAPQTYGVGVVVDATTGKARLPVVTDTLINGFLVRPYPAGLGAFNASFGVSPVDYDHPGDIVRKGYMSVLLGGAAASAKQGRVYVRKANAVTGKPIGGVEAAADLGLAPGVVTGTGNGTWTPDVTTPVAANAIEGAYILKFLTATTIQGIDPNGNSLGQLTIGGSIGNTVTWNDQIKGVVTQGSTVFIAGDIITVTTAFNTIRLGTNSYFTGPAYTDGTYGAMSEVAFNI